MISNVLIASEYPQPKVKKEQWMILGGHEAKSSFKGRGGDDPAVSCRGR